MDPASCSSRPNVAFSSFSLPNYYEMYSLASHAKKLAAYAKGHTYAY